MRPGERAERAPEQRLPDGHRASLVAVLSRPCASLANSSAPARKAGVRHRFFSQERGRADSVTIVPQSATQRPLVAGFSMSRPPREARGPSVSDTGRHPVRVLRVIDRLNVGGPALHVTYLSRGLASRGYETTLVAGDIARGEESMAFVAARGGRRGRHVRRALARAVASPRPDRDDPARRPDPPHSAADRPHAQGEGRRGRAERPRCSPPDDEPARGRPHVPRARPPRLLRPRRLPRCFARSKPRSRASSDVLVAVSPQVRDELVRLRVAPAEKFAVVRLGIELEPRVRTRRRP